MDSLFQNVIFQFLHFFCEELSHKYLRARQDQSKYYYDYRLQNLFL